MKYALGDTRVQTHADGNWIAPNAAVIGNVIFEEGASVWFNATLRGDNEPIRLGANSNVQDGCVLHTDPGFPLTLGPNVTVGHMVMLHGCTIGANTLIGVGSVILNGAVIGENCIIGAGSLIPEGKEIPAGSLVMGQPGKVKRELTDDDIQHLKWAADHYVERSARYLAECREDA
jgi:carbonic anhydrase/acetyltransferase-like protein (isoleucine patch superfamily)